MSINVKCTKLSKMSNVREQTEKESNISKIIGS